MIAFRHPIAFLLLIPWAAVLALFLWSKWRRRREFQALGDWRLLADLVHRKIPVSSFAPVAPGLEEAYLRIGIAQVD